MLKVGKTQPVNDVNRRSPTTPQPTCRTVVISIADKILSKGDKLGVAFCCKGLHQLLHMRIVEKPIDGMLLLTVQEVMTEPVIAADGHTYEKKAVQEWLQRHNTSPVTGSTLAHMRLVPNVLIRSVLARHRQQL